MHTKTKIKRALWLGARGGGGGGGGGGVSHSSANMCTCHCQLLPVCASYCRCVGVTTNGCGLLLLWVTANVWELLLTNWQDLQKVCFARPGCYKSSSDKGPSVHDKYAEMLQTMWNPSQHLHRILGPVSDIQWYKLMIRSWHVPWSPQQKDHSIHQCKLPN